MKRLLARPLEWALILAEIINSTMILAFNLFMGVWSTAIDLGWDLVFKLDPPPEELPGPPPPRPEPHPSFEHLREHLKKVIDLRDDTR